MKYQPDRITTSPRARIAAEIIDQLKAVMTAGQAGFWMLTSQRELGLQCSPIMALKDGREQEVRDLAAAVIAGKKTEQKTMCLATLQAELADAEADLMATQEAIKTSRGKEYGEAWKRFDQCYIMIEQLRRDIRLVRSSG